MVNLDNLLVYGKFDKSRFIDQLIEYPARCRAGWDAAMNLPLQDDYSRIDKVIILGMGGSAIGGEIAGDLLMMDGKVPVWSHRDYDLPAFVDDNTLVIAVSYSGNTEETLSAFERLRSTRAKVIVFTSGGQLAGLAQKHGYPFSIIGFKTQPRAAFPYMVSFLLGVFYKLGLLKKESADVTPIVPSLEKMVEELVPLAATESNRAKALAAALYGKIPVVYGAGYLRGVARRWKTQFNENGKNWAFFEVFPELLHNAAVGYQFPVKISKNLVVMLLRSRLINPRVLVQYEAILRVLEERGIAHQVIDAPGDYQLQQMLTVTLLGDFTSYYLAILNQTDPNPVAVIDFIKKYQAEH